MFARLLLFSHDQAIPVAVFFCKCLHRLMGPNYCRNIHTNRVTTPMHSVCNSYIYLDTSECKVRNLSLYWYHWSSYFTHVQAKSVNTYSEFYLLCAWGILVLSGSTEFCKCCYHKSNLTFDFCFRISLLCDDNSEIPEWIHSFKFLNFDVNFLLCMRIFYCPGAGLFLLFDQQSTGSSFFC